MLPATTMVSGLSEEEEENYAGHVSGTLIQFIRVIVDLDSCHYIDLMRLIYTAFMFVIRVRANVSKFRLFCNCFLQKMTSIYLVVLSISLVLLYIWPLLYYQLSYTMGQYMYVHY
jgi:hypothetical protein